MAVVTTYVCDVTGKSGSDRYDFVDVVIDATEQFLARGYCNNSKISVRKLVHKDVAMKLNLVAIKTGEVEQPEVSFEGKLKALLTDYIDEIVANSVHDAVSSAMSNRN